MATTDSPGVYPWHDDMAPTYTDLCDGLLLAAVGSAHDDLREARPDDDTLALVATEWRGYLLATLRMWYDEWEGRREAGDDVPAVVEEALAKGDDCEAVREALFDHITARAPAVEARLPHPLN